MPVPRSAPAAAASRHRHRGASRRLGLHPCFQTCDAAVYQSFVGPLSVKRGLDFRFHRSIGLPLRVDLPHEDEPAGRRPFGNGSNNGLRSVFGKLQPAAAQALAPCASTSPAVARRHDWAATIDAQRRARWAAPVRTRSRARGRAGARASDHVETSPRIARTRQVNEPRWLDIELVLAIHDMQIAEHGGRQAFETTTCWNPL
jgi:hypothetical protein